MGHITEAVFNYLLKIERQEPNLSKASYDSPFLGLLVSLDRKDLMQSLNSRDCIPGEVIIYEGENGKEMYIIWSGRVAIVTGNLEAPNVQAFKGAGEIIGELALIEDQSHSSTIIAMDHVRLLGINRSKLQQLLVENPSISLGIIETLAESLREANQVRNTGKLSEKSLIKQVSDLQSEKNRLEELQQLRQETSELIIHDLRNPLTAIMISLRMLAFTLPENILHANQEILDVAQVNCARMQRLVDSLLEVSRMEEGMTQFYQTEVDLPLLFQEVLSHIPALERKGVDIQTQFPSNLTHVICDREKIERVIINLLDNAFKYSPDGGVITTSIEEQPDQVMVIINDQGPGVPDADKERIFERFAQVGDNSVRRGFGLGLAYCKQALLGHGGRIWVEPGNSGVGSRFIFTLPKNKTYQ